MAHDKIRMSITRAEAADRLEQIAAQLRSGSVSLGGAKVDVANEVEFEAEAESDKLKLEIKWRRA
jgi:amphi-Trp domain-containing protein